MIHKLSRRVLPLFISIATVVSAAAAIAVNSAGGALEPGGEAESASHQSNEAGAILSLSSDPEGSPEQTNSAGGTIVPLHVLPAQEDLLDTNVWVIR